MFKRNPYLAVERFFGKAEGWLYAIGGLIFLGLFFALSWQLVGAWALLLVPGSIAVMCGLVVLIVLVQVKLREAWWRGKMQWEDKNNEQHSN